MIVAASEGVDVLGVLGLIAGVIVPVSLLATFVIKALIHKTVFPMKERQIDQDVKMQLLEKEVKAVKESHEKILDKLDKLPNLISETIKISLEAQERLYDLKYIHQKKQ
jgi:hypothetical protein